MTGVVATQPVQTTEQKIQWMQKPATSFIGCPPGLEYLAQVNQLLIHQQVEMLESRPVQSYSFVNIDRLTIPVQAIVHNHIIYHIISSKFYITSRIQYYKIY